MSKKFNIAINLDDEIEARTFHAQHAPMRGRQLANVLGFKGRGSTEAANALANYAINKVVACDLRRDGKIETAIKYETICDTIYARDIQPLINCW